MASAALSSCLAVTCKLSKLSLSNPSSAVSTSAVPLRPLSFSGSLSHNVFSGGSFYMSTIQKPIRHFVACEAAPTRKADSAAKRARQAETRRLRNKARKSEVKTRMKKALEALDVLRKKSGPQAEEILPIEKLIGEAYSAIDKAVIKGIIHKNTGARRKSRLARRKKAVEIHHGWYTPAPAITV